MRPPRGRPIAGRLLEAVVPIRTAVVNPIAAAHLGPSGLRGDRLARVERVSVDHPGQDARRVDRTRRIECHAVFATRAVQALQPVEVIRHRGAAAVGAELVIPRRTRRRPLRQKRRVCMQPRMIRRAAERAEDRTLVVLRFAQERQHLISVTGKDNVIGRYALAGVELELDRSRRSRDPP